MQSQNPTDLRNLVIAVALSTLLLFGWQFFYEAPQKQKAMQAAQQAKVKTEQVIKQSEVTNPVRPRAEVISEGKRVKIQSPRLHGSIALTGATIDDLTLVQYRETADPKSPEVVLLTPPSTNNVYFARFGWSQGAHIKSQENHIEVPGEYTPWIADHDMLTPESPVTLKWDNGKGQEFFIHIALDENYMFTIKQSVKNNSGQEILLHPYSYILRRHEGLKDQYAILHEGPLGVFDGKLSEMHYKDLFEDEDQKVVHENTKGWIGMSDKYWLAALIPQTEKPFKAVFSHYTLGAENRYMTDTLMQGDPIASGQSQETTTLFFAGAKEIRMLDNYAQQYKISLFDRAVDFGWLYFLTRPFLLMLTFINAHVGNFGIALMILTVLIKLAMYPLANKSYVSMNQMKQLQPEVVKLRERYNDDKMKMNQEMMALYKRNKVNPLAGCLPILIQIPVFFALYKVLFVSIEMRHAPFFGWIHDLSAPDPTNLFTLFGLLEWAPPSFLHLGVWPILMTISMVVQQKLQPAPTDPVQAKMLGAMPYLFLFLFASFPAGLVIYWTWSNLLSILQQWMISKRYKIKYVK